MQNRRVTPELFFKDKVVRTTTPEEDAQVSDAIARRKKFDEGKAKAQGAYKQILKEGAMKRSYTIDEMTVATLLKGHPEAQEILDELLKGKKKNESGEEFQDGSEDTIGGEGHAAVARPDSIKHEGKPSGIGPNEPGTGTKKASIEDGDLSKSEDEGDDVEKSDRKSEQGQSARSAAPGTDAAEYYTRRSKASKMGGSRPGKEMPTGDAALREYRAKNKSEQLDFQKSDNLADNLPDEFEDEMEDDDTIPPEKNAKKSMTADEEILSHLLKTMGADRMEEIVKAVIGGRNLDPGQVSKKYAEDPREAGNVAGGGPLKGEDNPLTNKKINPTALAALKQGVGAGGATKSEESDLEKSEDNMSEEYSLDFSKSIMERMGLEKGATSVSKEAGGGKATQINYGSKPTTRFKHPKAKSDKKYIHSPAKGTVKVEKEGEKTREIGVSEESKLKNASYSIDFSKSVLANMGLLKSDFEYVGDYKRRNEGYDLKNGRGGVRQHSESSEGRSPKTQAHEDAAGTDDKGRKLHFKESEYNKETGKMKISSTPEQGITRKRSISANAAHEKELKNASVSSADLYKSLDAILDKKRD